MASQDEKFAVGQEPTDNYALRANLGGPHHNIPNAHQNIMIASTARKNDYLQIDFHRTIRVPDNKTRYQLPPSMGNFPLYSVQTYTERLPKQMAEKGGIFFPMYQREAVWLNFTATRPFAIRIFIGGINAISGEPQIEALATVTRQKTLMKSNIPIQDYLVAGPTSEHQAWIDGIASHDGLISQFVAMPLGSTYTVEAQIAKQECLGGIQIEVIPSSMTKEMQIQIRTPEGKTTDINVSRHMLVLEAQKIIEGIEGTPAEIQRWIYSGQLIPTRTLDSYNISQGATIQLELRLLGGGPPADKSQGSTIYRDGKNVPQPEMGLAAGGTIRQVIQADHHPAEIWDRDGTILFNVQILNASLFSVITGLPTPSTPIDAATYSRLGYPFFGLDEKPSGVVGQFGGVETLGAKDAKAKGRSKGSKADPDLYFPMIMLDKNLRHVAFRPVKELERELKAFNLQERNRWDALGSDISEN